MKRKLSTILLMISSICLLTGCINSPVDYEAEYDTPNNIATDTTQESSEGWGNNTKDEQVYYGELSVGDSVPDFTATLADGSTFTLSEHDGSVILLNFWATWCGPCVEEMPAFERLDSEYGDELVILAVNCMEDKNTVDQFISANGYTFPVAYDVNGEISIKYPSAGIPYTLVIGSDGTIQNIYIGAYSADVQYQEYKAAIENALQ